ncbi:hypothetical protein INT43_000722 [Umbelopsis isabellina]|uniref:Uncharacterized protein n=1 Tax=Mortierella isabellina TaxID=91625 RepID=A0A8H7UN15_MORIS|nr:hypothetical protein INT43_000722 [Umbelopsis isabellina]
MSSNTSSVSKFLLDPWSPAKVAVPSIIVQAIIHRTVLEKLPIRTLTLWLSLTNTYWFATTLSHSFLDTPIKQYAPNVDKEQSTNIGRHIFSWLNKLEASYSFHGRGHVAVGVVSLDLFCVWRQKIIDRGGFVDKALVAATLVPSAIVILQSAYLLPTLNERADKLIKGQSLEPSSVHKQYIGFEAVKVVGLAVAGIRFGKLLTH